MNNSLCDCGTVLRYKKVKCDGNTNYRAYCPECKFIGVADRMPSVAGGKYHTHPRKKINK